MNRHLARLSSNGGWTLVELVLTVAILIILMAIAAASYETIKAKVRYSQIKADMDAIGQAAYADFSARAELDGLNDWPPMSIGAGMPGAPSNMSTYLRTWPSPPCPGWFYSWEDWSIFNIGNNSVAVTLRKQGGALFLNYCVNTFGGSNCYPAVDPAGFGGAAVDISVWPLPSDPHDPRHIYCNE